MLWPQRPLTPFALPRTPRDYLIQPKYNGWALVLPGDGTAWTRRGQEITDWECFTGLDLHFPYSLHAELYVVGGVATDVPRLKHRTIEPTIAVHDVMIERMPLEARMNLLTRIVSNVPPWRQVTNGMAATWEGVNLIFHLALAEGHKGLVLKRQGSFYHIGRTASISLPDWYKIKTEVELT